MQVLRSTSTGSPPSSPLSPSYKSSTPFRDWFADASAECRLPRPSRGRRILIQILVAAMLIAILLRLTSEAAHDGLGVAGIRSLFGFREPAGSWSHQPKHEDHAPAAPIAPKWVKEYVANRPGSPNSRRPKRVLWWPLEWLRKTFEAHRNHNHLGSRFFISTDLQHHHLHNHQHAAHHGAFDRAPLPEKRLKVGVELPRYIRNVNPEYGVVPYLFDMVKTSEDSKGRMIWDPPVGPAQLSSNLKPMEDYYLVAVTMARNEAPFLPEWVEYYILQGVDRIVFYDHGSTDATRSVLDPYIRAGIVEYIRWPDDFEALAHPPLGPRVYTWHAEKREKHMRWMVNEDCRKVDESRRPTFRHRGCQQAAISDAMARYRNRTRWMVAMDVDEYFLVDHPWADLRDLTNLIPLKDKLREYETFDQIMIEVEPVGTNGWYSEPTTTILDSSFTTILDRYLRRLPPGKLADTHVNGLGKSIFNPQTTTFSHIYGNSFSDLPRDANHARLSTGPIRYRHFQNRGVLNLHQRALNSFVPSLEYHAGRDALMSQQLETDLLVWSRFVKHRIMERLYAGAWEGLDIGVKPPTQVIPAVQSAKFYPQRDKTANPPQLCIALIHTTSELPELRKTLSSALHHLHTHEPNITYEVVLAAYRGRRGAADESFHEAYDDEMPIDRSRFFPQPRDATDWTSLEAARDAALIDLCTAPYVLSLEDGWETRYAPMLEDRADAAADSDDRTGKGGVSNTLRRVAASGRRILGGAMALLERKRDLLEVWVGDVPAMSGGAARARSGWISLDIEWEKGSGKVEERAFWYRRQGSAGYPFGSTRVGGSVKSRRRLRQVGRRTERFEEAYGPVVEEPNTENPEGPPLRHAPPASDEDRDMRYARAVTEAGFQSAHFCLGAFAWEDERSEPTGECALDPEGSGDASTTGIMWRISSVH
ncbi:hypothetical protein HK101_000632 [Irineochytrium annulatum]|nr:hypothetical protein HK101_000632 [Irineochytrium annulatum]